MRVHSELRSRLKEMVGRDVYPMFMRQRSQAKHRGIPFEMSFPQWAQVWDGKLTNRGSHRGQLVMCRPGDVGAYSVDNVEIRTTQSNVEEHHRLKRYADVKSSWNFDGEDRSSCVDWLENRRDTGYF